MTTTFVYFSSFWSFRKKSPADFLWKKKKKKRGGFRGVRFHTRAFAADNEWVVSRRVGRLNPQNASGQDKNGGQDFSMKTGYEYRRISELGRFVAECQTQVSKASEVSKELIQFKQSPNKVSDWLLGDACKLRRDFSLYRQSSIALE